MMYRDFFQNIGSYKILRMIESKINGGVIHLKPAGASKGNVLISYSILPFVTRKHVHDGHTNRWEGLEIAKIFLNRGYRVDVIDWTNRTFTPKKKYAYFLDIHDNLERLAPTLNKDCVKILHITTSNPSFQNAAENKRIIDLQNRRGLKLNPQRQITETRSILFADEVSMLGNSKTASTYDFAKKEIRLIPISTTHTFPSPENKNFDRIRKNFVWFGGSGMVHKGLDLVLEAFADMPDYNLTICGKVANEKDFVETYRKELFGTKNISVAGLVDPGSQKFREITANALALIYPSASEGQSGAVIMTMHAGLIPIVSEYTGVDVQDFGIMLKECSLSEIKENLSKLANLSTHELRAKAVSAWEYARTNHTREKFSEKYTAFVDSLEKKYGR